MNENLLSMILFILLLTLIITVTVMSFVIWKFFKEVSDPKRYLDPISAAFKLQQEEQRKHLDNIILQQTRIMQSISAETLKVMERSGSANPVTAPQTLIMQSPDVEPLPVDPVNLYDTGVVPSPAALGDALYSRANKIAGQ